MKIKLAIILITFVGSFNGIAQNNDSTFIKKTLFDGEDLSNLTIDMVGKIILLQGPQAKVEIQALKKTFRKIRYHFKDGKITISKKRDIQDDYILYVTVPPSGLMINAEVVPIIITQGDLNIKTLAIDVKISDSIDLNIICNEFYLTSSVIKNLSIKGNCNNFKADISVCSQLNSVNFECKNLKCEIDVAELMLFNVTENFNLKVKDHCNSIKLKGKAEIKFNQCIDQIIKI